MKVTLGQSEETILDISFGELVLRTNEKWRVCQLGIFESYDEINKKIRLRKVLKLKPTDDRTLLIKKDIASSCTYATDFSNSNLYVGKEIPEFFRTHDGYKMYIEIMEQAAKKCNSSPESFLEELVRLVEREK